MDIRKLNKWLSENGFNLKAIRGEDYVYYLNTNKVSIGNYEPSHMESFLRYCDKLGLKTKVKWNVMALLHELGHYKTIWEINDSVCLFDKILSSLIDRESSSELERELRCNLYYRLPTEKAATKWAIEYINNNPEKIKELEELLNGRRRSSNN